MRSAMDPQQELGQGPSMQPPWTSIHARRAIEGNAASLEWLVARLSPVLVAQAAYRLGSALRVRHDPEDLVQDAWLVALPRLPTLQVLHGRAAPALLKFLSSTIRLRVQNMLRQQLREGPHPQPGPAALLDAIACDASGVVTQALRRERRDQIAQRLEELEPRDREILLLRGIEQLPTRTIAMLLELSETAVAKRYERALARLRQQLPGSLFDELDDELDDERKVGEPADA